MNALRKKVYLVAGYNTISMGTGRKEFNPKKERPGLEQYIAEAGQATLKMIGGADKVDECVIGNFIASRFNGQANMAAFFPMIDPGLRFKPATRVEGACATGSLAVLAGVKSVLAETADVVLVIGVEVQNTVKAIYGADYLAAAGWAKDRKAGHAYFFPGQFSERAGAYFEKYGRDRTRQAFARWFRNAVENARLCPTAQEYHNSTADLEKLALMEPNGKVFVDHLNVFDCSKVSDGASAVAVVSEEGLKRIGIPLSEAVEVVSYGHVEEDITIPPVDRTALTTFAAAAKQALDRAGISIQQVATAEVHDCFTIAGIMAVEAIGLAEAGKGPDFVSAGHTARDGKFPINTTGGLIGWGHPTGGTGVHMAVTLLEQLTGKAGDNQITIPADRPFGLSVNMGGDDKTLVAFVLKSATA